MASYLLRVEGVNLYNFIQDTLNLNVIRGSGLILLNTVQKIQKSFPYLSSISTGASIGLFSFDADTPEKASDIRDEVSKFLTSDNHSKYATFVVDMQAVDNTAVEKDNFMCAYEYVISRNRWRQFQQPTVVLPESNSVLGIDTPCDLDNLRPAVEYSREIKKKVSQSVARRYEYGKNEKQQFYSRLSGDLVGLEFVHALEDLSSSLDMGNLHHKVAVIYLDGNRFGRIREQNCRTSGSLYEFDEVLKGYQRKFLKSIIEDRMLNDAEGYQTKERKLRIETLLWGGDEIMLVVPAWKGWNILKAFYGLSSGWNFKDERLTHAGGIVFCHHNASIHRISKLCKYLAEEAKKHLPEENAFQYLVLESFDTIGHDLKTFRKKYVPFDYQCTLKGEYMGDMDGIVRNFVRTFPKNQIYKAVHAAIADASDSTAGDIELSGFSERLKQILPEIDYQYAENILQKSQHFGKYAGSWIHLAELWDYIPQKENSL